MTIFVLRFFVGVFVLSVFIITGCTHTSLPVKPDIEYPAAFTTTSSDTAVVAEAAISQTWWQAFQSSTLDKLLVDAMRDSPDWLITHERVRQAEYQLRVANASWFPNLNLGVSSGEKNSEVPGQVAVHSGSTGASLSMNYEVDIWGGVAAGRRAAQAGYDASRFEQDSVRLSIQAAIATGWFQWLALQERLATAEKNMAIAERVMRIVDARYRNGSASAADVAQQQTNLLSQKASLLPLQLQARQTFSALAILVGQTPQAFDLPKASLQQLQIPDIPSGTPAALVLRRPDLAVAEANLIAADANLVQARTALLPGITLGASLGRTTSELFSLNPATRTSSWSVDLAQTLFSGGRLLNQRRYSEARRAELLVQYHKAILTALQEVDITLAEIDSAAQQEESQRAILVQAERSLRLVEARYREGSEGLQSLLEAQRSLFQVQDNLVQQRLARLIAAVDMYKALGGGWQLTP